MKKVVLAVLLTGACAVLADDNGIYVGADIGNTAMDLKTTFNGSESTVSDDGGSQTLKLGYYFDNNNRVSLFYQNINADGANMSNSGVGYDYLIGEHDFKPFVGFMVGYGSYDVDDLPINIAGTTYGAQIGLNYTAYKGLSLEVGYRYLKSNMEDTITGVGGSATFEIDPLSNWFLGANYKF